MTQGELIEELKGKLMEIKNFVAVDFYYLEAEQLNLKPNDDRWSAIQCLEHINLTNHFYIENFKSAFSHSQKGNYQSSKVRHGVLGRLMTKMMAPVNGVIKYKSKTFEPLTPITVKDPNARVLEHVVFENFMSDLDEMSRLLDEGVHYPLSKIKVPSFAKGVKFRAIDAFAFLISHTERHLLQAQNALKGI